jgi:hypothetical protein
LKTKFIAIIALIASIALLCNAIPYAHAQETEVPSTVEIIGVCGLLTDPLALDYGFLAPNDESTPDRTLELTNTGNVQTDVLVRGTNWNVVTPTAIPNAMPVSATHYSLTSGQAYGSKTALTAADTQLTTLSGLQVQNTFWQLKATLNEPAVGVATQTVTLTIEC